MSFLILFLLLLFVFWDFGQPKTFPPQNLYPKKVAPGWRYATRSATTLEIGYVGNRLPQSPLLIGAVLEFLADELFRPDGSAQHHDSRLPHFRLVQVQTDAGNPEEGSGIKNRFHPLWWAQDVDVARNAQLFSG